MKKSTNNIIIEFLGLIIGCMFMGVGLNMFFKPYTIAPGGLSGLSLVISKFTGLSVSTIMSGTQRKRSYVGSVTSPDIMSALF